MECCRENERLCRSVKSLHWKERNWVGARLECGRDWRLWMWILVRRRWDAEKGKWEWWNLCESLQQLMMKVCRQIGSRRRMKERG